MSEELRAAWEISRLIWVSIAAYGLGELVVVLFREYRIPRTPEPPHVATSRHTVPKGAK